ncbi:MAG: ATP-dependent RNA helicase HrpA [Phycisphaerales bacterium]
MLDRLRELTARLDDVMLCDRHRVRRRARTIEAALRDASGRHASDAAAQLERLTAEVRRSIDRRRSRAGRAPKPTYPEDLPVSARRDEITRAIAQHQVIVLCGETGSGKTTQLPKICLDAGRGIAGMIGHTQPRRIAARTVAGRIAEELGSPLGADVGYKVRFGDKTGPHTFVKVMTDGILLAETQTDRFLEQYDTIIIDEAHERSLNIDFLLGYLRQLLPRRPELKVIVTSATIDPQRFAKHFASSRGPAPIIEVSGRTYPVDVHYRPPDGDPEDVADERDMEDAILGAVDELAACGPGDILVFLSGEREIRETAEALRKHHPPQTEILPLYARLSAEEQMRVFKPHAGRRIVLATNVAETSLTVPGIRYVVDPGFARISRYGHRTKVQRLPIEPVSRASADQRKGRCGRVGPGVCVRLFAEADFLARPQFTDPEILRTNLASVILQMKALRLGAVEDFPFLDPPDARMIRDGYETLHELGAIDDAGELTKLGAVLARVPIDPRLARMVLAGRDENCLREVLVIAAALSIQDPRERPMSAQDAADRAHERFRHEESDFLALLNLWNFFEEQAGHLSQSKLRKLCQTSFLSYPRMREWRDVHQQLHSIAAELGLREASTPAAYDALHRALLAGLLSNVGTRTETFEYKASRGTRFHIFPASGLFKKGPKWVMAAEVVETTRMYARTVAKIDPLWIERVGDHVLKRTHTDPHWSKDAGHVAAFERGSLFGLDVYASRRIHYGPIDPAKSRELFIHHALVHGELRAEPPAFLKANLAVMEEVKRLEAKARRPDLLADESGLFAFYDLRLPADVFSVSALEKWLTGPQGREAERRLRMTRADVMRVSADDVTPERFPDAVPVAGTKLNLEYRLEPGNAADGVTMTVPIEALAQMDEGRPEWLVPGLLRDKIVALLRQLPKQHRKSLDPIPTLAEECAAALRFGEGDLYAALSAQVKALRGIDVPVGAWQPRGIPEPFRMNVAVIDEQGKKLAEGRDVEEIRKKLAPRMKASFARLAGAGIERDRIIRWDFKHEIPDRMELTRGGLKLIGYPALEDRGDSVSIRVFESTDLAKGAHRGGVRRVFALECREELTHQLRLIPDLASMAVNYAPLGTGDELRRALCDAVVDRVFVEGRPEVRTRAMFDARLHAGWDGVGPAVRETAKLVAEVLAARQALAARLAERAPEAWAASIADLRWQLDQLLPRAFLGVVPADRLAHVPRYLAAARLRLDKLRQTGPVRDQRCMADLAPHLRRWFDGAQAAVANGDGRGASVRAALEEYRWMIEEFRVSLFAQELGTNGPVSAKRLDELWVKVEAVNHV